MNQQIRFDKTMTNIVKGFAIIFMLILHCYNEPQYEVPLNFDHAFLFAHDGFNICVGMYAFMIGFGYAFSKTKDMRYAFQHIIKVYIPYLVIFFLLILPFCYTELFSSGWQMVVYTLTGLDYSFFYYNWFIYVFVFAMLTLPFMTRFIDKSPLRNTIILILVLYLLEVVTHFSYSLMGKHLFMMAFNCLSLSPIILLGYLFAREKYYERMPLERVPKALLLLLAILVLTAVIYIASKCRVRFGVVWDIVYAPLAIGAIVAVFSTFKLTYLRKVMAKVGWASMYMWFLQALFHTPIVRTFYQPIITIFNDINLVVLWTMVVLFFISWPFKSIMDYLMGNSLRKKA